MESRPDFMYFRFSSLVNAPVEHVFAFHERDDAIEILTPPWQPMQLLRRSGGLEIGTEVEFRVWMGPLPVVWLARHIDYRKGAFFTDIQVRGPFRTWLHTHQFDDLGGETRLSDEIEFTLPGAPITHWFFGWAVLLQLQAMFRYRHAATRRFCESKPVL